LRSGTRSATVRAFASALADQDLPDDRRRYGIGLALAGRSLRVTAGTVAAAVSPRPGTSIRLTFR
jgi:hypothetical protein